MLEKSREEGISEDDVEQFVRTFFDEFGGDIRGVRPGPARERGGVFQLDVPDNIAGGNIDERYDQATFTREVAVENDDVEFIALDHPLVQNLIEYCQNSDHIGGRTAIKIGADTMDTPRAAVQLPASVPSGRGETVTERIEQLYVTPDGSVQIGEIDHVGALSPTEGESYGDVEVVATMAEELVDAAENRAWERVNDLAEEAREERAREVNIKRKHAEQYFESRIADLEETLAGYQDRQEREETDMSAPINRVKSELRSLRQEQEEEFQRLDEDAQVVPDEPELINAAVVIGL